MSVLFKKHWKFYSKTIEFPPTPRHHWHHFQVTISFLVFPHEWCHGVTNSASHGYLISCWYIMLLLRFMDCVLYFICLQPAVALLTIPNVVPPVTMAATDVFPGTRFLFPIVSLSQKIRDHPGLDLLHWRIRCFRRSQVALFCPQGAPIWKQLSTCDWTNSYGSHFAKVATSSIEDEGGGLSFENKQN